MIPARRRLLVVLASFALVVLCANAGVAVALAAATKHEASAWPGSSFVFWPERAWQQVQRRVDSLTASGRLERRVLGEVRYREGSFPVTLLRFPAIGRTAQPVRVLLVSGVHGTETAGVEALLRTAEMLARDTGRFPDVSIDIVPVLNPWGWVYGYRYDGAGEDVNRDFFSSRTQEARLLRSLMRQTGRYDLVMDLHESKKPGYFIYQYLPDREGLGSLYVRLLKTAGRPRENLYREGFWQARDGILDIPAAALPWIALASRLSLEQYARLRGTRNAYTVETPVSDDWEHRVQIHRQTVEAFVEAVAAARAGR